MNMICQKRLSGTTEIAFSESRNQVRHILIILSIFLLTLPSVVYSAQNRVALVIGNGAYKECPLRNPVNDARLMSNLLRKAGFSVTVVEFD